MQKNVSEAIEQVSVMKDKEKAKILDVILDLITEYEDNSEKLGPAVEKTLQDAALWLG